MSRVALYRSHTFRCTDTPTRTNLSTVYSAIHNTLKIASTCVHDSTYICEVGQLLVRLLVHNALPPAERVVRLPLWSYIHKYIHMHTYRLTYTYIHTHMHTYTPFFSSSTGSFIAFKFEDDNLLDEKLFDIFLRAIVCPSQAIHGMCVSESRTCSCH